MSESIQAARQPAVYRDILSRTGGDMYVGVVGPVRTGKSTLIKGLMEKLVLPSVPEGARLDRMRDELPQAGSGRQVTTAQPHFVPSDAPAMVVLGDDIPARVRFIDSVGYVVPGAQGVRENDAPRMVKTPWQEGEMPFEEAARLGTDKVMQNHATMGLVVLTDGTILDLPRSAYISAEEQVIAKMKEQQKPFAIVLNTTHPKDKETEQLRASLEKKYDKAVTAMNVQALSNEDISALFSGVLSEFPIEHIHIALPRWMYALSASHPLPMGITAALKSAAQGLCVMRDRRQMATEMRKAKHVSALNETNVDLGHGSLSYQLAVEDGLFNSVLSTQCGVDITDEKQLLSLLTELSHAKQQYDRLRDALQSAEATGYGLVAPNMEDITLEMPVENKQGARYGVSLRASAQALHIINSPIRCEITPVLGAKEESEAFIASLKTLYENDQEALWNTNFFGRSLRTLLNEAMARKVGVLPQEIQEKVQQALTKMLNEGDGGMICILL